MQVKPYNPKTIEGAKRRVRELQKQISDCTRWLERQDREIEALKRDRRSLAMLSGIGCFWNPLDAFSAQALRDRILRDECNMEPNGKPLPKPPTEPA